MRIIITENQLKRILLTETKQSVITDEYLDKAKSFVSKLTGKGFTLEQSCAMAGNVWAESKFDPAIKSSNGAIGFLQWLGDRKKALISYATHKESKWSDESIQINFIVIELKKGYKLSDGEFIPNLSKEIKNSNEYEMNNFNSAMKGDTIPQKARNFAVKVERCGDCDGTLSIRSQSAKRIYDFIQGTYNTTGNKSKTGEKTKDKSSHSVGDVIYPKESDGYANIRKEPSTSSERIVKISSPNSIGTISKVETDDQKNKWFKVTLSKKVDNYSSGWVRSDVVK
jgi:hypothetical protein